MRGRDAGRTRSVRFTPGAATSTTLPLRIFLIWIWLYPKLTAGLYNEARQAHC